MKVVRSTQRAQHECKASTQDPDSSPRDRCAGHSVTRDDGSFPLITAPKPDERPDRPAIVESTQADLRTGTLMGQSEISFRKEVTDGTGTIPCAIYSIA